MKNYTNRSYYDYYQNLSRDIPLKTFTRIELKKIQVNISLLVHNFEEKLYLPPALLAIQLITKQKGKVNFSKKWDQTLKIDKGKVTTISTTLRGRKAFHLLEQITVEILPRSNRLQPVKQSIDKEGNIQLKMENLLLFSEIEEFFNQFYFLSTKENQLLPLTLTLVIKGTKEKNFEEGKLLATGLKLPSISKA